MNNLISVVIPCYNDFLYIEQAIDSVLEQPYPNIEIIVVDDGSNEKTKKILKKITPKITKLIIQNNKGQSTARNVGISESKGDFIFVLDSDDYISGDFFDEAIQLLKINKNLKIVTCYANLIYDNGSTKIYKPRGGKLQDFLESNCALGTSFFRKKDWILAGKYDENMKSGFEDWEFFIRLIGSNGICEVIPKIGYNYRKRKASTTVRANKVKYDLLKYIYFKHSVLYKQNFKGFVQNLLEKLEREEIEKNKKTNSLEYQMGSFILKPFKFIKNLFK